ncbi:hypothetical protein [Natrialba sp. INN-245]|uniref:hypothetical protein n=1 Tax=Natrialba sp. INN-245 TaxID=2690967 RepID=UPI001310B561|nr:hypothetical protein [Natrialba sp. INN-245]MWV38404.1 hypothetical protein [Natrialba sp. INN-245]
MTGLTVATVDGKTRTLTVTVEPHIEDRRPYRCQGLLVYLEGYGTEYTLECPSDPDQAVRLLFPSTPSYGVFVRVLECVAREMAIISDTSVEDLFAAVR